MEEQPLETKVPLNITAPLDKKDREEQEQARQATSRNYGTPVAIIRSPTQRMGDALNALRP